jgi:putative heme transporter
MKSEEAQGTAQRRVAAAQREMTRIGTHTGFRVAGVSAWLALGMAALLGLVLFVIALVADVAIPFAIAVVLAAILVPLVDRLERWRLPRWLGASFVLLLAVGAAVATVAVIVAGLLSQSDEIWAELEKSLDKLSGATASASSDSEAVSAAHEVVNLFVTGALGSLFSSAGSLVVGTVLAIFMLLFLLKDWNQITSWTMGHVGLPAATSRNILAGTVTAFRGYAAGLTLIGLANALVVAAGALLLGVPMAGTIALVSFVTSYVPYLGAFIAGAFAVLIAYGSGGLSLALAMLAIVLLANNSIQNIVEPFAFGTRLRLHPLAVLLTVTTASLLFGFMGAILAAPLTSAAVNAYHEVRDQGDATESSRDHPPSDDAAPATGHTQSARRASTAHPEPHESR